VTGASRAPSPLLSWRSGEGGGSIWHPADQREQSLAAWRSSGEGHGHWKAHGTGFATHHGACVFWAALFETLRSGAADARPAGIARDAALVSVVTAIVDYGLVPKRLTPGWEEPLPVRSVAGGFARLGLGLVIGGLVTSRYRSITLSGVRRQFSQTSSTATRWHEPDRPAARRCAEAHLG
jgi:hypothetical protein